MKPRRRRSRWREHWLGHELAPIVRAARPLTASVRWLASRGWWDRVPWLRRAGVPLAVSLAVHAIAGGSLFFVALAVRARQDRASLAGLTVLSFREPSSAAGSGASSGASAAPSVDPPEAPELRGAGAPGVSPAIPRLSRSAPAPKLTRSEGSAGSGAGVTFAGLASKRAARVVYVVDASGAMVSSLRFVLPELERSIAGLASDQEFQVVFFRARAPRPGEKVGAGGLVRFDAFDAAGGERAGWVRASAEVRSRAAAWARGIGPTGRSVPLDGLRAALALEPDAVFLLSRSIRRSGAEEGWGGTESEILAELDRLNPRVLDEGGVARRRTVIKTIQFVEDDPTGIMRAIAREHGDGERSYRVLTLEELGVR